MLFVFVNRSYTTELVIIGDIPLKFRYCEEVPVLDHSRITATTRSYGDVAVTMCHARHMIPNGRDVVSSVCGSDEEWHPEFIDCNRMCTSNPEIE